MAWGRALFRSGLAAAFVLAGVGCSGWSRACGEDALDEGDAEAPPASVASAFAASDVVAEVAVVGTGERVMNEVFDERRIGRSTRSRAKRPYRGPVAGTELSVLVDGASENPERPDGGRTDWWFPDSALVERGSTSVVFLRKGSGADYRPVASTIVVEGDDVSIDDCGPYGGRLAAPFAEDIEDDTATSLADRLRDLA